MHERSRYTSIQDYVALLRRRRLLILAVAAAFALAALALSLAQTPSYRATASVAYRDVTADLPLFGGTQGAPDAFPQERAARNGQIITSELIARDVKRRLKTDLSTGTLLGAVSARVGVQTGLLDIEANWSEPEFAAKLANAFAEAGVEYTSRLEKEPIETAINGLEARLGKPPYASFADQATLQNIAQLRALKELAEPAEISRRAEAPDSPASPRTVRNTVLGLLVGLAFGLVAAFVRDTLDRKIRGARDAHDELGAPVLGRIRVAAMGSAGLAGNGHYVDPREIDAFRVLRTNLAFFDPDNPARTVLVTSGLAQEGKSTVSAMLASVAAASGYRVLLVDADVRRPVLAERLGVPQSPGLTDYLAGTASPQDVLRVQEVSVNGRAPAGPGDDETDTGEGAATPSRASARLACIPAGAPQAQPAALFSSGRLSQFVEKVGKAYDLVVIDSSPLLVASDAFELAPLVDMILVCVRVSWSTRDELRAVRHALDHLPERPTGVVLTGLKNETDDYAYGYYGYEQG
ncbi:MAG: Wzz/FepE/Etk N-terminal domain-containing protein [Solirubrobacterales bacterium]